LKKVVSIVSLCFILGGCVSAKSIMFPAYIEPSTNLKQANLTIEFEDANLIKNSNSVNKKILRFKGEGESPYCSSESPEIIAILNNVAFAAGIDWYADKGENTNIVTIKIPANEAFRMSAFFSRTKTFEMKAQGAYIETEYCQPNLEFVPEEGKSYLASYNHIKKQCNWTLSDISENGKSPLKFKSFKPCITDKDPSRAEFNHEPAGWGEHVRKSTL